MTDTFTLTINRSDITNSYRCLVCSKQGHIHDTGYIHASPEKAIKAATKEITKFLSGLGAVNEPSRRWV